MKKSDGKKTIRTRVYKNKLKSADKAPYLVKTTPGGVVRVEDVLQEVARATGGTVAQTRLALDAMQEVLQEELQKGRKVQTPFGTFELAISGTVPSADSPVNKEKNKTYVVVTPPASLKRKISQLAPVVDEGRKGALVVTDVITVALGERGYNVVVVGEPFVVAGDGFAGSGELSVTLTDAKGARHAVTVTVQKKTSLVCKVSGAVAKGKATLKVALAEEDPDVCVTASRKVTVR